MASTIYLVGFLLGFVAILVVVLACVFCVAKKDEAHQLSQALLDQNYLEFTPGMKRSDVEELLVHADRWKCPVCKLDNLDSVCVCSLCGTQKEERTLNRLRPLNRRQRAASSRNEWQRELEPSSGVTWRRQEQDSSLSVAAFVLHIDPCTPNRITAPDQLNHATGGDLLTALTWSPLDDVQPSLAILGKPLPPSIWLTLLAISRMSFSLKYAWFIEQTADLTVAYEKRHLEIKTTRELVFEKAVAMLQDLRGDSLCAIARCQFQGEAAIDAGAVQREWYMLVAQSFVCDTSGLFYLSNRDDSSYFINPNSSHNFTGQLPHLDAFRAAGRFMGRALLSGQVIPFRLSPVLFKAHTFCPAMLQMPLTIEDVETVDPTVYKSLCYILETPQVDELALTFVASERIGHEVVQVELVAGGANIAVDDSNKAYYVELMTRHWLFGRVETQLTALLQGLYDIVPPELLLPFDHKELELVLCGLSVIDVSDWKTHTMVSLRLRHSRVLDWFWEIVESMPPVDQATLLQFATGSSRVPVQGFKGLTSYDGQICYFALQGVDYVKGGFPVAHACFNRLDLPLYPTKELLRDALALIVQSDPTGFSLE
ncbi:Aste57867_8830 [Aphanomyces stellatus]|uniref:HECT-type E3 ubiquitin transferase n=1 Tax=Aphanomyces stellatus TaxID=120398 RepID=A0A485KL98_9STRA|nr:hypothetical protein As57867_008795 [Aphanomyces stellatus]VFT85716.1 Aste57867_8830 [Aphanomyces stellatus]